MRVNGEETILKVSGLDGVTWGKDVDRRGHPFDTGWRRKRREHKEDRKAVARNTEERR